MFFFKMLKQENKNNEMSDLKANLITILGISAILFIALIQHSPERGIYFDLSSLFGWLM